MINERDIAEKFSAIWKKNFPLLTPNFIKVFNDTQIIEVNTYAIEVSEDIRYDLTSEIAFNLSEIVINKNLSANEFVSNKVQFEYLINQTAKNIWKSNDFTSKQLELSKSELEYVLKISDNIVEFISKIKKENVSFRPKLHGYGFIPDLDADLSIDDTLYEVKTVTRNFKSTDLKQLFIYLALKQVSDSTTWKYGGLYNPRRGTYCKFNVKSIIYNITGGKTPNEAFENLLNGLVRDIEVDSKF